MKKVVNIRYDLFTIIEIVVAIAVLAIGLTASLGLISSVSQRMNRAMRRWERKHMLAQAAEYFLVTNDTSSIPEEFFPYTDYRTSVSVEEPENLPEGMEIEIDKWKLVKVVVKLYDETGEEVDTLEFEKIIPIHEL